MKEILERIKGQLLIEYNNLDKLKDNLDIWNIDADLDRWERFNCRQTGIRIALDLIEEELEKL